MLRIHISKALRKEIMRISSLIRVLLKKGDYHFFRTYEKRHLALGYLKRKVLQQFEYIFCR